MLKIHMLGPFQLFYRGNPVPETAWHTKQARQLLKILLTQRGKIVSRDFLIDALWPDADPTKAATTLRTAVNALRKTLEPDRPPYTPSTFIFAHAPGYKFHFTDQVWIDVFAFEEYLARAAQTSSAVDRKQWLAQAIALYPDDFLSEDPYAEWAFSARERFVEQYLDSLTLLAECYLQDNEYQPAIANLQRVLTRDPGREPVYRTLMRAYAQQGNTVAALKTFEQLRNHLATELGADPSPQTMTLHQSILVGQTLFNHPAPADEKRKSVFDSVFIGRRKELGVLVEALEEAQNGRGGIITLTGETGVGKTRLAFAALEQADSHQIQCLSARCLPVEQVLPFAPVSEALESLLSRDLETVLPYLHQDDKRQLARLLPSVGWLAESSGVDESKPEESQQQLLNCLTRILIQLTHNGLILFIDDVQWVDQSTLLLISAIAKRLSNAGILVLLAYRPEEVIAGSWLARFLHDLNRHRLVRPLNLQQFSIDDVEDYLRAIIPDFDVETVTSLKIASKLHQLTGGNPLFLAETLRSMRDAEAATPTLSQVKISLDTAAPVQPSDRITDTIQARLANLSSKAVQILDLAAVIGRDFSVNLLETACTADPMPELTHLIRHHFLTELNAGRLDYSHQMLREVILARLSPLARQRLHLRVSQALITLYGSQPGPRAVEIARHSLLAGRTGNHHSLRFSVLAGDYAQQASGFEEACQHYQRALDLSSTLPELESWISRAYQGLGATQEMLEAWDAARETYKQWQWWAQKIGNSHWALLAQHRQASMLALTGQLEQSAAIMMRISMHSASDAPPALGDAQKRLNMLVAPKTVPPLENTASWPHFPLQLRIVEPDLREIARFLGDDQAAQTINLYGWALTQQGQTEAAEMSLDYAAQLAEANNQPGHQATTYHLLAQLWGLRGDYSQMAYALQQALTLVEDIPRLRWIVIWGLIHQAFVDIRWNCLARAKKRFRTLGRELSGHKILSTHRLSVQVGLGLVAMFEQRPDDATIIFDNALADKENLYAANYVAVLLSRARIHRKKGRLEQARQDTMMAMTFAAKRGMLANYISVVVEAARLDCAAGQPYDIRYLLQDAETLASQAGLLSARVSVRLALYRVYQLLNADDEAAWYRRLARTDRDTIAASIPDADDRAAYLSRPDLKLL